MSMSSSVYVTKTIDELLFKGYYDPLLGVLKQVSPFLPDDAQIEDHNFGWFYKVRQLILLEYNFFFI